MNYNECRDKLEIITGDPSRLTLMEEEFGEVEEIFIASSDFLEMHSDLPLIKENDFEVGEDLLTSQKQDYAIYILTYDGELTAVPTELLE